MRRGALVFTGGGLGACLRALTLQWLAPWGSLPAVLLINVLGAALLGAIFVLADEVELIGAESRLFVAVGLLGGFTTFSTFAWGADVTVATGHLTLAITYVTASAVGGVTACILGIVAARESVAALERMHRGVRVRRIRGRRRGLPREMEVIETEDRDESA
jgi:fluoride exporter